MEDCSWAGWGGRAPVAGGGGLWRPALGHILVSEVLAAGRGGAAQAAANRDVIAANMADGAELGWDVPGGGEGAGGAFGHELDGNLETGLGCVEGVAGDGDEVGGRPEGGAQEQAGAGCLGWQQLGNPGTLLGPTASAR